MDKKNIQTKYFTPEIEDIRIGYIYEQIVGNPQDDISVSEPIWIKCKFPDPFIGNRLSAFKKMIDSGQIRVPYLTKEQIGAEGWEFIEYDKIIGIYEFRKMDGKTWYELSFYGGINTLIIEHWRHQDDDQQLFNGQCRCINDFRYICKLLNIN